MAAQKKDHPDAPQQSTPMIEEGRLTSSLARAQAEAAQGEPGLVKLKPPAKSKDGEEGDDCPPSPPVAEHGIVPRLLHENERAPTGLKRFKIRAVNYGADQPTRYVLARNEEEAREFYIKSSGIAAVVESMEKDGVPEVKPRLSVRAQPD